MTTSAKSVLSRVSATLNDLAQIRVSLGDLVDYFNDGQLAIVQFRPDATLTRIDHALVEGHQQTLPDDSLKLISVNYNSASKIPVTKVSTELMDAQMRGWRASTKSKDVLHFMYDPLDPLGFEVYPPAAVGASLNLEHSRRPEKIEIPTGGHLDELEGYMAVSDLHANALANYILFRCYSRDTEALAMPQMAGQFYSAFATDLGIEYQATKGVSSKQTTT